MTPRYLQETVLTLCIIIGAIVCAAGIVCLFIPGFSKVSFAVIAVLGAGIFFGFLKIRSLCSDYEDGGNDDDPGGAP